MSTLAKIYCCRVIKYSRLSVLPGSRLVWFIQLFPNRKIMYSKVFRNSKTKKNENQIHVIVKSKRQENKNQRDNALSLFIVKCKMFIFSISCHPLFYTVEQFTILLCMLSWLVIHSHNNHLSFSFVLLRLLLSLYISIIQNTTCTRCSYRHYHRLARRITLKIWNINSVDLRVINCNVNRTISSCWIYVYSETLKLKTTIFAEFERNTTTTNKIIVSKKKKN